MKLFRRSPRPGQPMPAQIPLDMYRRDTRIDFWQGFFAGMIVGVVASIGGAALFVHYVLP